MSHRQFWCAIAASGCFIAFPASAAAEPASGLTYEQSEARAEFIALVRKARQGDADSQWLVGKTYVRLGEPAKAVPMLLAAGASGHAEAATLLAALYEDGRGVQSDLSAAKEWYRRAAGLGHAPAMAALGRVLRQEGHSNATETESLLRRSAELSNPEGQYQLAIMLSAMQPGDRAEELDWFVKAARQGHIGAQVSAAALLLKRNAEGDRLAAIDWLERAAKAKDPVASYLLARVSSEQKTIDFERIRETLTIAATAGHREAQFLLGKLLADSSVLADKTDAASWLEKASQNGHLDAANRLGELYLAPVSELRHLAKARQIFQRAAEQGNASAMYNLARMQSEGLGGESDSRQALIWYSRAAEAGHEGAADVVETLLASSIKSSALGFKGFWQK
jgi:TPR repeat protein